MYAGKTKTSLQKYREQLQKHMVPVAIPRRTESESDRSQDREDRRQVQIRQLPERQVRFQPETPHLSNHMIMRAAQDYNRTTREWATYFGDIYRLSLSEMSRLLRDLRMARRAYRSFCTDIRQKFRWSNDLESLRSFAIWLDQEMERREQGAQGSTTEEEESEPERKKDKSDKAKDNGNK